MAEFGALGLELRGREIWWGDDRIATINDNLTPDEWLNDVCACAHFRASHPWDGACTRVLGRDDPDPWHCPCEGYVKVEPDRG